VHRIHINSEDLLELRKMQEQYAALEMWRSQQKKPASMSASTQITGSQDEPVKTVPAMVRAGIDEMLNSEHWRDIWQSE